jgi:hypothetical protein
MEVKDKCHWRSITIEIDGVNTEMYYEAWKGQYMYFVWNDKSYKVRMQNPLKNEFIDGAPKWDIFSGHHRYETV